ncbi:hypothetical protein BDFB_012472 [Asbolus verrucosus]|uniref:Uncharacterized protein n=1 Tax=Asbolus verrucosus TaxID=1661398 RepID=A0A482W8G3_ASBVE|nr:hypothetical protein BDFB_012472 [Asbolus verrucosus]
MLLIGIFSGGECTAQSPFNDQKIKEQFPSVHHQRSHLLLITTETASDWF